MDYINKRFDGELIPSKIQYFAVYDPLLSSEDSSLDNSMVSFLTPNNVVLEKDQKQRELSMVEGLYKFNKEFDKEKALDFIELNDKVVIVQVVEERYYLVLSVMFNKFADDDSDGSFECNKLNMAPFEFLKEQVNDIYKIFKLHNGDIKSLFENLAIQEFQDLITNYFSLCFTDKFDLDISEDGFLKSLDAVRTSSLTIDYNLTEFIKIQESYLGFKELLIWNDNDQFLDEYGLVYKYRNNLSSDYLISLLKFIAKNDHYNSLNKENLLQSFISINDRPKSSRAGRLSSAVGSEEIFNPFKAVVKSFNSFNELTGVSHGLNYGVDTIHTGLNYGVDSLQTGLTFSVDKLARGITTLNTGLSSGLNMINNYFPFTAKMDHEQSSQNLPVASPQVPILEPYHEESHDELTQEQQEQPTPIISSSSQEEQDVEYLVGLQPNGTITYKNVYLKFKEEEQQTELKLHKLVIFKILNFKFLIIYGFDQNCIEEMEYYGKLSEVLFKINQSYLINQQKPIGSIVKRPKFYYIESYPDERKLLSNIPSIPPSQNADSSEEEINDHYDDLRNSYINKVIHKALYKLISQDSSPVSSSRSTKETFIKLKNWSIWIYRHDQSLLIMLKKSSSSSSGDKFSNNTNIKLIDDSMVKKLESFRNHH